jgi:5-methylcytosine-specific restriction endonuclease McrA
VRRSPKAEVKALDQLCRRLVFLRDRNTCQKCGSRERLQWAHVHSRGVHSLRWEPDNSLCLCAGCHYLGHLHPTDFSRWLLEKFPKRLEHLLLIRQTKRKTDKVALRLWLENECHKLEAV